MNKLRILSLLLAVLASPIPALAEFPPGSTVDFGEQAVGTSSAEIEVVRIRHFPGSGNTVAVRILGQDFIRGPSSTCPAVPQLLSADCILTVMFAPTSVGPKQGTVVASFGLCVPFPCADQTWNLEGTGVPPPPQTVSWKGLEWFNTFPSSTMGLNVDGTLSVYTGDTEFGFFGGASHQTPSTLQAADEAWAEATYFDTASAPGAELFIILFESPGSAFYASLGAVGNEGRYRARWRRDSPNPAETIPEISVDVGPRSFGPHTAKIGRRAAGRLEFWLDGTLAHVSDPNAFPATFNFVSLIASAGTAAGQQATFIDYSEGAGLSGECHAPPFITGVTASQLPAPGNVPEFFHGAFEIRGGNFEGGQILTNGPLALLGSSFVAENGNSISNAFEIGCCVPRDEWIGRGFDLSLSRRPVDWRPSRYPSLVMSAEPEASLRVNHCCVLSSQWCQFGQPSR